MSFFFFPESAGRLCQRRETEDAARIRSTCDDLEDYQDALSMSCRTGIPGRLVWTPDENTPDVVYYQVRMFTLRRFRTPEGELLMHGATVEPLNKGHGRFVLH